LHEVAIALERRARRVLQECLVLLLGHLHDQVAQRVGLIREVRECGEGRHRQLGQLQLITGANDVLRAVDFALVGFLDLVPVGAFAVGVVGNAPQRAVLLDRVGAAAERERLSERRVHRRFDRSVARRALRRVLVGDAVAIDVLVLSGLVLDDAAGQRIDRIAIFPDFR
jgi:hypothetical protein